MAKSSIHPAWYPNAKVFCDGQLILKLGSTKPSLNVDIWSGNHPFYTGSQKIIEQKGALNVLCVNTGWQIKKAYIIYIFIYGNDSTISKIQTIND